MENVGRFIQMAKKYLHLEKLTSTVLNDMVNAIYVHALDKSSGHRIQDVDISYNDIGILPANLLYEIQTEKRCDRNHAVSRKLIYCFIGPLLHAALFLKKRQYIFRC